MGKLGDTLRERRIALGLSLEQVQDGTRIRQKLLEALEEGHYERLPNPGYVRGYISSYARFLELDAVPLLNMYKAETGAGRQHNIDLPQAGEAVAPTGQQHAVPWKGALFVALAIGFVALAVWAGARLLSGPESPSPIPAPVTEETSTTQPSKPATEQTAKPKQETTKKPAQKQPFTVTVQVDNDGASWLRVAVDGKTAYEGTLTGGQSKQFEVTKEADLRIGKPEAVTVLRDGSPVEIETGNDIGVVTLKAKTAEE